MSAGQVNFPSAQSIAPITGSFPFYPLPFNVGGNLQNYQFSYHANTNAQPVASSDPAAFQTISPAPFYGNPAATYQPIISNMPAAIATSTTLPFTPTIPSQPANMPTVINLNGSSWMLVPIFADQTATINLQNAALAPTVNPQPPLQQPSTPSYASSLSAASPKEKKPSTSQLNPNAEEFVASAPFQDAEPVTEEEPTPLYNYRSPLYTGPAGNYVPPTTSQAQKKLSDNQKPVEKPRASARLPILPWTDKATTTTPVSASTKPPVAETAATTASASLSRETSKSASETAAAVKSPIVVVPTLPSTTSTVAPDTALAASPSNLAALPSASSTAAPKPLTEEQEKVAKTAENSGLVHKAPNEAPKLTQPPGTYEYCLHLFDGNRLDEALSVINNLISEKPENKFLYIRALILYNLKCQKKGNDDQAFKDLALIIQNSTGKEKSVVDLKIKALNFLANLYYKDSKIDEAQKLFEEVVSLSSDHHHTTFLFLALIAFEKGKYGEVKKYLTKLINCGGPSVLAFIKISEKLGSEKYNPADSPNIEIFKKWFIDYLKHFRSGVFFLMETRQSPSEKDRKSLASTLYQTAIDTTQAIARDTFQRLQAYEKDVAQLNKGCFFSRDYGTALIESDQKLSAKNVTNSEPTIAKRMLEQYKQSDCFYGGSINPKFFTRFKITKAYGLLRSVFGINDNVKPSDALAAAIEGPTLIDDALALKISMYKAIMQSIGKEKFDAIFSSNHWTPLYISNDYKTPLDYLLVEKKYKKISELQMGEMALIANCTSYHFKHFSGEKGALQVMCLEPGVDPKLLCLSLNPKGVKLNKIIEELRKAFNRPEIKYTDLFAPETVESLRKAMSPSIQEERSRYKNKVLNISEFIRLGGGNIEKYTALDIDKIEKLKKASIIDCKLMLKAWQMEHIAIETAKTLK